MDWNPTTSVDTLRQRSRLTRRIRRFFEERGFDEVQTPVLGHDTVVDIHIDPIPVSAGAVSVSVSREACLYLQTSPEFAMKRLLAAGMQAIYQIAPAFRAHERGPMHNPEFSMLEWYRVGDDLQAGVALLADLTRSIAATDEIDIKTYQEVFSELIDLDPIAASDEQLHRAVRQHVPDLTIRQVDRDECLNALFAVAIQPQLGHNRPIIVTHYPASQAALARLDRDDPRVAERFELFINGIELANGYHELTDPEILMQRFAEANRQRAALGRPPLPENSRLLAAMRSGLPACSGCALGLDRLLMVVLGKETIDQVMPFPIEIA